MKEMTLRDKAGVMLAIFALTVCYQLFLATSLTPIGLNEGNDSLVFKHIGLALLQGKVPYIDLFDHKGPIVYFIDALGIGLTSGRWGLYLVYCLYIAMTTYIWWLTAALFVRPRQTVWPVAVALAAYLIVNVEGNLTEEWSLLPISYGLYVFVRHFVTGEPITTKRFFLVGIAMGVVTFLRINNMAAVCCAILFYIVYHLYQRDRVTIPMLFRSCLTILSGWALVFAVCCLAIFALYGSEGLEEMLYGTFTFNFEYMGFSPIVSTDRKKVYLYFGLTTFVILLLLFMKKRLSALNILIALCYAGSFIALGTKGWSNYFIILAPVTLVAAAALSDVTNRWQKALVFLMFFAILPYRTYLSWANIHEDKTFYEETDNIIRGMTQEEHGRIWNDAYFDGLTVLHRNGLIQANRVMLPFQLQISERLARDEAARFEAVAPLWIMTSMPFEEWTPMPLDSVRTARDYALYKKVERSPGRYVYFYRLNRKEQ